mmetsp:Transcript_19426/g.62259  ORF Transcript_19426/g.62259 Transcript_19426/m.62259 type:complete len:437 (+) Transcript_19426:891-2201(+)
MGRRHRDSGPNARRTAARIAVLRQGGAAERELVVWRGRERFVRTVQSATTAHELLDCVKQLEEASFDSWRPGSTVACPCCIERRIPDGLPTNRALEHLRDLCLDVAVRAGIALDDRHAIAHELWLRLCTSDCMASSIGFCSLTRSCRPGSSRKPNSDPWTKRHQLSCGCDAASRRRKPHIDGVMNANPVPTISRIQFAEGLAQGLGIQASWSTLMQLSNALVTTRSDRINLEAFRNLVLASRPPLFSLPVFLRFADCLYEHITFEGLSFNASCELFVAPGQRCASLASFSRHAVAIMSTARHKPLDARESHCAESSPSELVHAVFGAYANVDPKGARLTLDELSFLVVDVLTVLLRCADGRLVAVHPRSKSARSLRFKIANLESLLQGAHNYWPTHSRCLPRYCCGEKSVAVSEVCLHSAALAGYYHLPVPVYYDG